MNQKSTGSAGQSAQQTDAISLLLEDHRKVLKLFDEFKQMCQDENAADEAKQDLVDTACNELTLHAQLEQDLVYPALRDSLAEGMLIEQALIEHQSATQLINELQMMQAGDEFYDAKFLVLSEYVRHHINEEQDKIFPQAKDAKLDLMAMGEQLQQRKQALQEEMGLAADGESRGRKGRPAKSEASRTRPS